MIVEGIREFQKELTKYLNVEEAVIIRDKKTRKTRGVFLPVELYNELVEAREKRIFEDAVRTFGDNPASEDGIDTLNKGLE